VSLGPVANPADATYLPRPEWYYLPVFQFIKYFQGAAAVLGIVVIPGVVILMLFALPFLDRSPERRPLRRPVAVGSLLLVLAALVFLGVQSGAQDRRDPAVRAKLEAQEEAERAYAKEPFSPEENLGPSAGGGGAAAAAPAALSPDAAKGALLFESEGCSGCHGAQGHGGGGLFALANLGKRFPEPRLTAMLHAPRPDMTQGGMQPVQLKSEDMQALVAFLLAPQRDTVPPAP